MNPDPLAHPCPHTATPQEQARDPEYLACNAAAGAACTWARRYDGVANPSFHSERLEAISPAPLAPFASLEPEDRLRFEEAVLATGLV